MQYPIAVHASSKFEDSNPLIKLSTSLQLVSVKLFNVKLPPLWVAKQVAKATESSKNGLTIRGSQLSGIRTSEFNKIIYLVSTYLNALFTAFK